LYLPSGAQGDDAGMLKDFRAFRLGWFSQFLRFGEHGNLAAKLAQSIVAGFRGSIAPRIIGVRGLPESRTDNWC
jgi:hypothetical protein